MLHGLDGTYGAGVAFILGCDAGTSGILLSGFREWLIVRLHDGNNLSWPALVLQVVSAESVEQMKRNLRDPMSTPRGSIDSSSCLMNFWSRETNETAWSVYMAVTLNG
jgi:hypothetical protein